MMTARNRDATTTAAAQRSSPGNQFDTKAALRSRRDFGCGGSGSATSGWRRCLSFLLLLLVLRHDVTVSAASSLPSSQVLHNSIEAASNQPQKQQHRRQLGDVSNKLDGKWQEFENTNQLGSSVYGCADACSASNSSEPLKTNNSPWTFTAPALNCVLLEVIEGYQTGGSVYQVSDNSLVLGNTSLGQSGSSCDSDPDVCYNDTTKVGRAAFVLAKAVSHSIDIKVVQETTSIDGGWFRLRTITCPITNAPTTRAPTASPGTSSHPTTSTAAPTHSPTATNMTSTMRCLSPAECSQALLVRRKGKRNAAPTCGCPHFLEKRKRCVQRQAKRWCCPDTARRPSGYMKHVVQSALRRCSRLQPQPNKNQQP